MEGRTQKFLSNCANVCFGPVCLSEQEIVFYREFNRQNTLLVESMPESLQKRAKHFLEQYSGVSAGEEPDFFKNYHAPAWSVIYWIVHAAGDGHALPQEDINSAITAHSMALNLHSLDDHLNDGEIPVSHLTLLLRSQSWMIMNTAFDSLASGIRGGRAIVRNFFDDYYSSVCGPEATESLENYCDLFRNQMATWLIAPALLSRKRRGDDKFTDAVLTCFCSFGIAWRLLDDLQDLGKDLIKGVHSAVYVCLPQYVRSLWDENRDARSRKKNDQIEGILDFVQVNGVVDLIKEKVCSELDLAAVIAEDWKMKGLADELRYLATPLRISSQQLPICDAQEKSRSQADQKVLSIEVTTHCNSACTHCFVRAGLSERLSLPADRVKAIISEGRTLDYRHLHITGGEPLLWEGLFDTLDYGFKLGYESVFLNTNGMLLTRETAAQLADYGGLSLSVSLEGPEALHDTIRGKGSCKRTRQGIDQALDSGIELVLFTTARKSLMPVLPGFVNDVYKRFPGIRHLVLVQLIRVKDDILDLSSELLDPDDFLKFIQMASLLNVFGYKVGMLNNPLANVASNLLGIWGIPESAPLHRAGDLIVKADLRIAPAHSTRLELARYEPGMIEKVLSSDDYLKAVLADTDTCPFCRHSGMCEDAAMVRPSAWYRDMNPDIPYCRRVLDRASDLAACDRDMERHARSNNGIIV